MTRRPDATPPRHDPDALDDEALEQVSGGTLRNAVQLSSPLTSMRAPFTFGGLDKRSPANPDQFARLSAIKIPGLKLPSRT